MEKDERLILREWIESSSNIVFFGGAGVSTESGIPDFRSIDGLYHMKYDYPPETILSHTFYLQNRQEFFRFYRERVIFLDAQPNKAHGKLAELEKMGKVKAVITQNIDGLHQAAGSREVLELHGSVHRNYCEKCKHYYSLKEVLDKNHPPVCSCGGFIKPDVVLYEESLNQEIMKRSIEYIQNAEVLIIGGTSLAVYPAAGLIDYYRGNKLILINKTPTTKDTQANLVIYGSIGEIMGEL